MKDLLQLRQEIDEIDKQWVRLLAHRFEVGRQVGELKKSKNLPPVDLSREEAMFLRIEKLAKDAGLNPQLAQIILRSIIDETVKNHKIVAAKS